MPVEFFVCVDSKAPVGLFFSRMLELPGRNRGLCGAYGGTRAPSFLGPTRTFIPQQNAPTAGMTSQPQGGLPARRKRRPSGRDQATLGLRRHTGRGRILLWK